MITDFSGDFLNFDSTEDGDIVEILNEGKVEFNETLKKNLFNLQVKKGEKVMTYSPNNQSGRALQEAYGKDSSGWVGKKFQVFHLNGKMAIKPLKN